ncbi:hypothetical protein JGG70_24020, partial [Salmonella enterica subsp. enterica serovar Typhimurium]|nr:hypothetical protein [Salmonella enterica subsp. enterica serovar Typhimurium]
MPISASHCLNQNATTASTRKELLAVLKAVEHFHRYLYGQKFLVRTYHGALRWLMSFRNPEGHTARWIQRLQEYHFTTEHRSGCSHRNADALSRRPCAADCKSCSHAEVKFCPMPALEACQANAKITSEEQTDPWSPSALRCEQLEDRDIGPILRWKETSDTRPSWETVAPFGATTKSYWAQWDSLELRDGVVYRRWENPSGQQHQLQLLLPKSRVADVLQQLHDSPTGGHFGVAKMLAEVKERFYWLRCRSDV